MAKLETVKLTALDREVSKEMIECLRQTLALHGFKVSGINNGLRDRYKPILGVNCHIIDSMQCDKVDKMIMDVLEKIDNKYSK